MYRTEKQQYQLNSVQVLFNCKYVTQTITFTTNEYRINQTVKLLFKYHINNVLSNYIKLTAHMHVITQKDSIYY